MDNDGSGAVVHQVMLDDLPGLSVLTAYLSSKQVASADLLLLFLLQCTHGSWVYYIPGRTRTRVRKVADALAHTPFPARR